MPILILISSCSFSECLSNQKFSSSSNDYYANITANATDDDLRSQLFNLINPHTVLSYDDVWNTFPVSDVYLPNYPCSSDSTQIPDIYSANCWTPKKNVTKGECGNYKKEGDCFNREHVWPKSWFGGFDAGMNAQTDLFELWPSDGYVNGIRGNYPLGFVQTEKVTYTSTSGAKLGPCSSPEPDLPANQICFELPDYLKGDIARSYFYLSTAYYNVWSCCDDKGVNASAIKPWMEKDLRAWHLLDPVDASEESRNSIIYEQFQHNRNPFIDHPEWVEQISKFD